MVLVKADEPSEAGRYTEEAYESRARYKEELVRAGIILAGEGLAPTSEGKRVVFVAGEAQVVDGPFPRRDDLVAGFWIWQVDSMEQAVSWLQRAPFEHGTVELRRIQELADFGRQLPPDMIRAEHRRREQIAARQNPG